MTAEEHRIILAEALKHVLEVVSEYRGAVPPNATPSQIAHEKLREQEHDDAVHEGKVATRMKPNE